MFLLPPDVQSVIIRKIARALNPNDQLLFTHPKESIRWQDALTSVDFFRGPSATTYSCAPRAWFSSANRPMRETITTTWSGSHGQCHASEKRESGGNDVQGYRSRAIQICRP
jgi:hypothetical protein